MYIKQESPNRKPSRKKSRKEVLRLKLQKLFRLRFGNHFLPDSDDGRTMLTALLCVGLTNESAIETAPWCEIDELRKLKRQARQVKWWRDKTAIGKLIGLTFDEWVLAKLWLTGPIDRSEKELEAWREERRKISCGKSNAKQRAKKNRDCSHDSNDPATKSNHRHHHQTPRRRARYYDGNVGARTDQESEEAARIRAGQESPRRRP
jgi:hypothetical protein